MVLENVLNSPNKKSPPFRRHFQRDELGSWSTIVQRHRFLLTALVLLTILCTVYLYFAVTFVAVGPCSGLTGAERVECHLKLAKNTVSEGKLKHL